MGIETMGRVPSDSIDSGVGVENKEMCVCIIFWRMSACKVIHQISDYCPVLFVKKTCNIRQ